MMSEWMTWLLSSVRSIDLYGIQDHYLIKIVQENKSGSNRCLLMGHPHSGHGNVSVQVHVNDRQVV